MKITAIKAQVKNPDRVSIYIDDAYSFSLTPNQLLEQKLYVGLELDEVRLADLKKASDYGKLYERLLKYALLRPHSTREMQDYCRRIRLKSKLGQQFDPEDCRQIITILTHKGYINDASFAKSWIESRRLTKSISTRTLRQELKQKGIPDDLIAKTLSEVSYDEQAALHILIAKKQRLSRYKDKNKLMQYLLHRGFGLDEIRRELEGS